MTKANENLRNQVEMILRDNARRRAEIVDELGNIDVKAHGLRVELAEIDEGSKKLAALLRDL